jgi:hypothetical protein
MNRRQFVNTVLGVLAVSRLAFAKKKLEDHPAYRDLSLMAGLQHVEYGDKMRRDLADYWKVDPKTNLFVMRSKYVKLDERELEEQNKAFFGEGYTPDPNPPMAMALGIDPRPIPTGTARSLSQWRVNIAQRLLANADTTPLPYNLRFDGIEAAPFNVRRHSSKIAMKTRRGCGNVIVCSRTALPKLGLNINENERKFTEHRYRIVLFEDGEVCPEPFALIGYGSWTTKYDHAIVMAMYPQFSDGMIPASVVTEDISKYWRRMI